MAMERISLECKTYMEITSDGLQSWRVSWIDKICRTSEAGGNLYQNDGTFLHAVCFVFRPAK